MVLLLLQRVHRWDSLSPTGHCRSSALLHHVATVIEFWCGDGYAAAAALSDTENAAAACQRGWGLLPSLSLSPLESHLQTADLAAVCASLSRLPVLHFLLHDKARIVLALYQERCAVANFIIAFYCQPLHWFHLLFFRLRFQV